MDEKLLHKVLVTVEEVKTITDLANRLYLSQPYISQLITKTEVEYNVCLVNRRKTPISLTPAGKELVLGLEKILNDRKYMSQRINQYSTKSESTIKIAITPIWISRKTSKIIQLLQQSHPYTQFEIYRIFTSNDSLKLLENGSIDIFWGAQFHNSQLLSNYVYRSRACIIVPFNHPLFDKNKYELLFSQKVLNKLNYSNEVSLTNNSAFQKIVDHLFEDADIKLKKAIKVNDFIGAAQLSIEGWGISVTLNDVLEYLNNTNKQYNIIPIPSKLINLDVAITINKKTSSKVKKIVNSLLNILNKEYKKE